jgi:hypothetical protein
LYRKAASLGNIDFRSFASITDLLVDEGEVTELSHAIASSAGRFASSRAPCGWRPVD